MGTCGGFYSAFQTPVRWKETYRSALQCSYHILAAGAVAVAVAAAVAAAAVVAVVAAAVAAVVVAAAVAARTPKDFVPWWRLLSANQNQAEDGVDGEKVWS